MSQKFTKYNGTSHTIFETHTFPRYDFRDFPFANYATSTRPQSAQGFPGGSEQQHVHWICCAQMARRTTTWTGANEQKCRNSPVPQGTALRRCFLASLRGAACCALGRAWRLGSARDGGAGSVFIGGGGHLYALTGPGRKAGEEGRLSAPPPGCQYKSPVASFVPSPARAKKKP